MTTRSVSNQARFQIGAPLVFGDQAIRQFESQHPNWFGRHATGQPAYMLPPAVITELSRRHHRQALALLQEVDAERETAFADLCQQLGAVGVWQRRPVHFPYLGEPTPPLTREQMRSCGWSNAQILHAQTAAKRAADATSRLKGYVGWLVTDPQFLREQEQIKHQWEGLNLQDRPDFPLQRGVDGLPVIDGHRAGELVAEFQNSVDLFLDRRGLMQLASWDLPQPQGPLIPSLLPPNSPAMPRHGLHIVLPIHYPVAGNDDLVHQIQQQQIALAQQNNLDTSLAGLPRYEVYAQMFEVEHIERTIRSRYGHAGQRGGFVTAMEFAIGAALGVRIDHIKRLRKGISACKRGRRSTVRWLRPTAGR